MSFVTRLILSLLFAVVTICSVGAQEHSVAREYSEALLDAIRNDFARPTVHARNLCHLSLMMYDIWSLYDEGNKSVYLGDTIEGYHFDLPELMLPTTIEEIESHRAETIAHAADRLLRWRFRNAPKKDDTFEILDRLFLRLGFDSRIVNTDYENDPRPSVLGNLIADKFIEFGLQDGANEEFDYANTRYRPTNRPMIVINAGNDGLIDPNRWQPLAFEVFIGQAGNIIPGNVPAFQSPEWGDVIPFSLNMEEAQTRLDIFNREYKLYKDPGDPVYLTEDGTDQSSADYKWNFSLVSVWSSMTDPADSIRWDISPGALGNLSALPTSQEEYEEFYNLFDGGDNSTGRAINPITNQPYAPQEVLRGDFTRVLAEYWADGPDSETPPGHWFTILHRVMDDPLFSRRWMGQGSELDDLEYDVKAFMTLGGTMHDAAIATWSIKGWYDYIRPISAIRYMASVGQSSDPSRTNYHVHGLPLIPGYIEIIEEGDPLATDPSIVGEIKVKAWRGPDFIGDPEEDTAGVGWVRGDFWWPYQRPTFVSPPFAGYVSGHSTFSRAAAEVLTLMTGDPYFPGGMGIFNANKNEFLVFENGPSEDIVLQWATYRDASDQTSLSRIWGGIHPPIDDIPGRKIGIEIAIEAFNHANSFFKEVTTSIAEKQIVNDGFKVFPNPARSADLITIAPVDSRDQELRVSLYDFDGRLVRAEAFRPAINQLDLSGLKSGLYTLSIEGEDSRQVSQVVIVD